MGVPILDPTSEELPKPLLDRPVYMQDGQVTTYRLMQDIPFLSNRFSTPSAGAQTFENQVKYLVNAEEAYPDILAAIKTATGKPHFVYILCWYLDLDVSLSGRKGGGDTLRTLLPALAAAGVQCRAMLWRNAIMVSDRHARRVFAYGPIIPALALPTRFEVRAFTANPSDPTKEVAPPAPPAGFNEALRGSFDVPGDVAPSIFDGSPTPWWAPGLGSGPVITPHNKVEVDFFNALKSPEGDGYCAAILDSLVPVAGAHHHKIVVVNGSEGLTAFVGGLDINDDRYTFLYDVHSRVTGPAAGKVLGIFNERWNSHPDRAAADKGKPHQGNGVQQPGAIPKKISDVQIARTYANANRPRPSLLSLKLGPPWERDLPILARHFDPFPGYRFAPNGTTEVWEMYKAAVNAAQSFIYIENQYFVSEQFALVLKGALSRLRHLTILIEGISSDIDRDSGYSRTKKCIDIVRGGDPTGKKLRVLALRPNPTNPHRYVHSKTMIVDDDYAIIGTANTTRRSFNCDSEAAIGVFDRIDGPARFRPMYRFAHRLRVRLWAELLGMNTPDGHAQLADPLGAIAHWEDARTGGALVGDYDAIMKAFALGPPAVDEEWDFARDPFNPGPT